MLQVVLDVNVLVSAVMGRQGPPGRLVQAWEDGAFEVVASPALLAELEGVLARPRVARRVDEGLLAQLRRALHNDAIQHDDPSDRLATVVADPRDDYLVALARSAGALVIVTGDRHLLDLEDLRPPALDPAAFMAFLDRLP